MELLFDLEADGLLDEVTKIHCVSYYDGENIKSITTYDEIKQLFTEHNTFIGHNIVCYDIPVLEKILNIKIEGRFIDTLALSWYLNTNRQLHGLESFGEQYNIPKPKIDNWENLPVEEYINRCEEDVRINLALWNDLQQHLSELYPEQKDVNRIVNYLSFKMDCLREQSKSGWKLDLEKVKRHINELTALQQDLVEQLVNVMPIVPIFVKRKRPKKPFKKDGTYSVLGAKWFHLLNEKNLDKNYEGEIEIQVSEEQPNPNSPEQVKSWLYSLGWEPETFTYVKDDDGSERKIPQIRTIKNGEKVLCPSVIRLTEDNPQIKLLEQLSVIQHRLGIFKGFMKNEKDGWLKAEAHGLTNTLRFKHKSPLVNLPGVDKPWGKEIRSCLIVEEGQILCGSDMVSLEDTTKRHYMYDYDPDYVKEMEDENFDPHLDLAKSNGVVTQEEIIQYKEGRLNELKPIRQEYKVANYSCIYGVGPPKLARELKTTVAKAAVLIQAYWKRNWSIKALVEDIKVIVVRGQKWLFNPVSKFYYSLRFEKDIFSTLNQGTGVYCFDTWIKTWRQKRKQLTGQFHDEIIASLPEERKEQYRQLLRDAIDKVNNKLKLNVKLDIDIQFGKNYAEIH